MFHIEFHTKAGKSPGFPLSTHTAVELSWGSYGHLAIPKPIPGTYSDLGRCVKFDYRKEKEKNNRKTLRFLNVHFIH